MIKTDRKSLIFQPRIYSFGTFAVVDEDNHFAVVEASEKVDESRKFVWHGAFNSHNFDAAFDVGVVVGEVNSRESASAYKIGERVDGGGGSENERACATCKADDAFHFLLESEFERFVVFIEDEGLNRGDVDMMPVDVVNETAGRGDYDLWRGFELFAFDFHRVASVKGDSLNADGKATHHIGDLND